MVNFGDLLGTLLQSGTSTTARKRAQSALGAGGAASGSVTDLLGGLGDIGGALSGMLGGGGSGGAGGIGGMLAGVLGDAGKMIGGNNKLALGGLGALAGSLLGGGGKSVKGAVGGGVMALLGAMALSALKGSNQAPAEVPLGLREPENTREQEILEQDTELVLKAMINAAKSDGRIDSSEIQRILGKLQEEGMDQESRDFVLAEINKPMNLQGIVSAARQSPQLAAQIYAASLLAIEVDTPAERDYLQQLAGGMGLHRQAVDSLESAVGLR